MNNFEKVISGISTQKDIESRASQNSIRPGRPKLDKGEIDMAERLRTEAAGRLRQRRLELGYSDIPNGKNSSVNWLSQSTLTHWWVYWGFIQNGLAKE